MGVVASERLSALEELDLSCNPLGCAGASRLALALNPQHIATQHLTALILSHCAIARHVCLAPPPLPLPPTTLLCGACWYAWCVCAYVACDDVASDVLVGVLLVGVMHVYVCICTHRCMCVCRRCMCVCLLTRVPAIRWLVHSDAFPVCNALVSKEGPKRIGMPTKHVAVPIDSFASGLSYLRDSCVSLTCKSLTPLVKILQNT